MTFLDLRPQGPPFNGDIEVWDATRGQWSLTGQHIPSQTVTLSPSGDTSGAIDTTNINKAYTKLQANPVPGGTIVLGAGDWYTSGIQFDIYTIRTHLKVQGQGQATRVHTTFQGVASNTSSIFFVYGGGDVVGYPGPVGFNWIEIADMWLVGNSHNGAGIMYYYCWQGAISNVYVQSCTDVSGFGAGIALVNSIDVQVKSPICIGNTYGMLLNGASCNNNTVRGGWLITNTTYGCYNNGAVGNNFLGTVFQGSPTCYFEGGVQTIKTNLFGCWFENSSTQGAMFTGLNTLVSGAVFAGSQTVAFVVAATAQYLTVTDCWFFGGLTVTINASALNTIIARSGSGLTLGNITDNGTGTILRDNSFQPVGSVVVVVPSSGTAVATKPYDRTFYVSTVAGTTACSMAIQSGPTITFVASTAQVIPVLVPAGKTVTPTYTGTAPTWVVEGN